jgi:hypothetical protein
VTLVDGTVAYDHDANGGTLAFGDPFTVGWPRVREASYARDCTYDLGDGATHSAPFFVRSQVDLATSPGPIVPIVGPPTAPKVNGQDAQATVTQAGLAPLISWSPPALGTANRYILRVFRMKAQVQDREVARFALKASPSPQLQLPQGLLEAGYSYVFDIVAISTTGDPETAPYRYTFPFGAAGVPTGLVTP